MSEFLALNCHRQLSAYASSSSSHSAMLRAEKSQIERMQQIA